MKTVAQSTHTAQQNVALDARVLHVLDVQARHLVYAALKGASIEEVRVVNRPHLAIQIPQHKVPKRRASSIVYQDQRRRWIRPLVGRCDLNFGGIGAVFVHYEGISGLTSVAQRLM